MTDEDLSELAECLLDACRGLKLRPFGEREPHGPGAYPWASCCPLGAMVGERYPNPGFVAEWLGIPDAVAYGIARGFDGKSINTISPIDERAYYLGRLFREELAP